MNMRRKSDANNIEMNDVILKWIITMYSLVLIRDYSVLDGWMD